MGGCDNGHHDHGPRMKVPDYRIYKVENHQELLQYQELLKAKGLKDPWIRNEAWRFDTKEWGTPRGRMMTFVTRGMKYGFAAFLVTIVAEKAFAVINPPKDHHGHH